MKGLVKRLFEKAFKCRVYRNSLPRGADLFFDIERHFGSRNIGTVFDIGANIGQSAIAYSQAFPQATIYSFEPVSDTFRELQENTAALKRVRAFHCAFGNVVGSAEINLNKNSVHNSILHNVTSKKESISIRRVDDFVRERSIGVIDFMKIDTEGYELEVLKGAEQMLAKHRIGILVIEAEPFETDRCFVPFGALTKHLREFEYELFCIYEQQPYWTGEKGVLFFNAVFISKELAQQGVTPGNYPLQGRP